MNKIILLAILLVLFIISIESTKVIMFLPRFVTTKEIRNMRNHTTRPRKLLHMESCIIKSKGHIRGGLITTLNNRINKN